MSTTTYRYPHIDLYFDAVTGQKSDEGEIERLVDCVIDGVHWPIMAITTTDEARGVTTVDLRFHGVVVRHEPGEKPVPQTEPVRWPPAENDDEQRERLGLRRLAGNLRVA